MRCGWGVRGELGCFFLAFLGGCDDGGGNGLADGGGLV